MFDFQQMCRQHGIAPLGVIHVGAHEGNEWKKYQAMGARRAIFIEANPAVYKRLAANLANTPNAIPVLCAVSDTDGVATLHVTSVDQSTSLLPLKRHSEIYPSIVETHRLQVPARTLDTLVKEMRIHPEDYNILNIDSRGAELLAFTGATGLLRHIQAIFTEVNFEEMYGGCPLLAQVDDFLARRNFARVALTTPYHPSWGGAMYVKAAQARAAA